MKAENPQEHTKNASKDDKTPQPRLREIRGIGEAVANRIIDHFGSEDQALLVIKSANVSRLSAIEGIGSRLASRIVREYFALETGVRLEDFLRTEDGIKIYLSIQETIRKFASTSYARNKLEVYFPLQGSKYEEIKKRQSLFHDAMTIFSLLKTQEEGIRKELRKIFPLREPRSTPILSRLICSSNTKLISSLTTSSFSNYTDIMALESIEEVMDLSHSYDEVLLISDEGYMGNGGGKIQIISENDANDPLNLYPERIITFFAENKNIIEALIKIATILKLYSTHETLTVILANLNLESLIELYPMLEQVSSTGSITPGINAEFDRLKNAEKKINEIISDVEAELNDKVAERIEGSSVELKGERLLSFVKSIDQATPLEIQSYLSETLYDFVEDLLINAEKTIITQLGLKDEEEEIVNEQLFPREVVYPLHSSGEAQERLERYLRSKRANQEWILKSKLAKKLAGYQTVLIQAVERFFEIDFYLMLGDFANTYDLVLPTIEKSKTGFDIQDGFNLNLKHDALASRLVIEPVSYRLGAIGAKYGELAGRRIVLLSGANSGGKTTLLHTLAHCTILTHMGFAIPAMTAIIGLYDELYYFRKVSGASDAGAFEQTLNMLATILERPSKRLVLADEMESISEPGASARVISAFLNLLNESPETGGVFVSHLAGEIMKLTSEDIRVDGIEAQGLDENLNLIVNRSPRFGFLARSTPQLIVERLVHLSKGERKRIYEAILQRFQDY